MNELFDVDKAIQRAAYAASAGPFDEQWVMDFLGALGALGYRVTDALDTVPENAALEGCDLRA